MTALIDTLDTWGLLGPGPAFTAAALLILAVAAAQSPTLEQMQEAHR